MIRLRETASRLRFSAAAPLAAVALVAALAACGSADDNTPSASSGTPSGGISPSTQTSSSGGPTPGGSTPAGSPVPRSTPAAPPTAPTDQLAPGDVVGTVLVAAKGSCVTLVTDDGVEFVLYNPHRIAVTVGKRMRAKIGPPPAKPMCTGGDRQATATTLLPVG